MNKFICIIFLFFITLASQAQIVQDEIANELDKIQPQPFVYSDYNYESTTRIPIELKSLKNIKSEQEIYEGQILKFKVAKDVYNESKNIVKRGDIISAKVSVIITPGMNGNPASIILKDFESEKIKSNKLTEEYEIQGQDRMLWVYPLKWALTILPPAGSLTNFIMGGHAKIMMNEPFTIYYYPDWK